MGLNSDSINIFIENGLSAKTRQLRKMNWIGFQKKVIKELPVTVLFGKRLINVVSTKLHGVKLNSNGFLYNAKEFWLSDRK